MSKHNARKKRAVKTRKVIAEVGKHPRMTVHRTPQHLHVQLFSADGSKVLASASTVEKTFKETKKNGGNVAAAVEVGKVMAERITKLGIKQVAFDRSGFKYHGRLKALADTVREEGIQI